MEKNKILYAEDDDAIRNLTLEFLEKFEDYNVESFLEGISLKNRLEKDVSEVALVITDNQMPGSNGFSLIKDYAKKEKFEKIPFILFYGGHEAIGKKAIENGAFAYFLKGSSNLVVSFSKLIERALDFSEK